MSDAIESVLLTRRITAGAKAWMLGAGFKPVVEEVPVGSEWIADLAGFTFPTPTEMKTSLKLHKLIDAPQYTPADDQIRVFFDRYDSPLTAICEVKVSAADFRSDMDRKYSRMGKLEHPGHLAYLAFPKGMLQDDRELPYYWGHLIFSQDGSKLLKVRPPYWIASHHQYEITYLVAAIGQRCFNKWWYREMRAMVKEMRQESADHRHKWRLSGLLRSVLDIFDTSPKREPRTGWERQLLERTLDQRIKDVLDKRSPFTEDQLTMCSKIDSIAARHKSAIELVGKQAEDEALWLPSSSVEVAYLQQELRKLHSVLEITS